jgi:hypothetical protein
MKRLILQNWNYSMKPAFTVLNGIGNVSRGLAQVVFNF